MTEDRISFNRPKKWTSKMDGLNGFFMKKCLICDVNNFAGLDNMP